MMRRLLRFGASAGAAAIVGYAIWMGGQTLYFYFGPSEEFLSETGFDRQAAEAGLLENIFRFQPAYPFWSDGATKHRYLYLPNDAKIDTSNPDRWNFPPGTRLWKTFERDEAYIETRMLYKTGPEPWQWDMAVYMPRADRSASVKLALSKNNVGGTDHDIPAPSACVTCHGSGKSRRPLGITALQIPWSDEGKLSLTDMIRRELLSEPPEKPYVIPGNAVTKAALGYFDTNCGSCHLEGSTYVSENVPLRMNLTVGTLSGVETTNVYRTAINQEPHIDGLGTQVYIRPGDPAQSFVFRRMAVRDKGVWQMPPLATELADTNGLALIKKWILELGR